MVYLEISRHWNWETPATKQPFLDLEISIRDGSIVYELYRKPINTYQYLQWNSAHPDSTKKGFVQGEVKRIVRNCTFMTDAMRHIKLFYEHLRRRGYPPKITNVWISQIVKRLAWERYLEHPPHKLQLPTFRLKVKYNEVWETSEAKQFRRTLENELIDRRFVNNKALGDIYKHHCHVQYCKSLLRNIGDYCAKINKNIINRYFAKRYSLSTHLSTGSGAGAAIKATRTKAIKNLDNEFKASRRTAAIKRDKLRQKRAKTRTKISARINERDPEAESPAASKRRCPRGVIRLSDYIDPVLGAWIYKPPFRTR